MRHSSVSPTHSNGFVSVPKREQRAEAFLVGRLVEGFVAGEHGGQLGSVHVRGEDQIDEAALVTAPAPMVEPLGRVLIEGTVAAAEYPVVLGESSELRGDPQLAAGPQIGEDGESRTEARVDDVGEGALELLTLRPLVVDGVALGHLCWRRGRPLIGQHDRVATFQDGGNDRGGGDDGRNRHVTVQEAVLG